MVCRFLLLSYQLPWFAWAACVSMVTVPILSSPAASWPRCPDGLQPPRAPTHSSPRAVVHVALQPLTSPTSGCSKYNKTKRYTASRLKLQAWREQTVLFKCLIRVNPKLKYVQRPLKKSNYYLVIITHGLSVWSTCLLYILIQLKDIIFNK